MRPNITFFKTRKNMYMYDGNTGEVLLVDAVMRTIISDFWGKNRAEIIENLKDRYRIEEIDIALKNIETASQMGFMEEPAKQIYLDTILNEADYDLQNNKGMLTLSVTQNCNLRCEYCAYSGIYEAGRVHSEKTMDFNTAKKAIDYTFSNAASKNEVFIGFYGGEPLLRFDLIKQCIEYVKEEFEGKKANFNITTNGTLLKDKYVKYFVENEVTLYISLDGPEEYHNEYRKFAGSGEGSFKVIRNNILNIKERYPEYYRNRICFGITVSPYRSMEKLEDFIWDADFIYDNSYVRVSGVAHGEELSLYEGKKNEESRNMAVAEENFIDLRYMHAKVHNNGSYLNKSKVCLSWNDSLEKLNSGRVKKAPGELMLPRGSCIPGADKMYVSTDGEYFICEKCDETNETLKLGNVDDGIDKNKSKKILEDFYRCTSEECPKCWASLYCTLCPIQIEVKGSLSREKKLKRCHSVKLALKDDLTKYMTILERNPYAFD